MSSRISPGWMITAIAVSLCGGLVAGAGLAQQEQPDPKQLEHGHALYVENCQPCHGTEGKGDGPAARFLESRPRDLTAGKWKVIEDGSLPNIVRVISEGVDDTDMEPFTEILTKDEIHDIALYVSTQIVPHDDESGR